MGVFCPSRKGKMYIQVFCKIQYILEFNVVRRTLKDGHTHTGIQCIVFMSAASGHLNRKPLNRLSIALGNKGTKT